MSYGRSNVNCIANSSPLKFIAVQSKASNDWAWPSTGSMTIFSLFLLVPSNSSLSLLSS